MKWFTIGVVPVVLGSILPGTAGAMPVWLHARVVTEYVSGEEITYFRAITTSDRAGTTEIVADRICLAGIAHQVHEKCEEHVSLVEVMERLPHPPGAATLCAETRASVFSGLLRASTRAGTCPLPVAAAGASPPAPTGTRRDPPGDEYVLEAIKRVTGTIQHVNGSEVTLVNGMTLTIPPTVPVERTALTPGATLKASYHRQNGKNIARSIDLGG